MDKELPKEGSTPRDRERALIDAVCHQFDNLDDLTTEADEAKPPVRSGNESSSGDLPPPDSFPGYNIIREIHRGGQGVVYLAIQKATKRKVAIKVLREGHFAGPRDKARLEREIQILGQLSHPNIVDIHDSGTAKGHFYYVMDYISGQPLDIHMAGKSWTIEETLHLFVKICDAVNSAHLRGVIHRDLKPGNIKVDANGEPHILDFGLAKTVMGEATDGSQAQVMSITGQFIGSLPWASPEQAEGIPSKIDIRTDVYSLGLILYQMLTGKFPYRVVGNMAEVLDNIVHADPIPPSRIRAHIDDDLDTIILKSLQKERERRHYENAGHLAREIRRYLNHEPIEVKGDSTFYLLRKTFSRYRRGFATVAIFSILVIGAIVGGVRLWRDAAEERERHARLQEAAEKVDEASAFLRQRTELSRAHVLLNEAITNSPGHERAYFYRGILEAMEGLGAEVESKPYYVNEALADLLRAHILKGGRLLPEIKTVPRPGPAGSGSGSPPVLWEVADLLTLTSRGREAISAWDAFQKKVTTASPPGRKPATPLVYPISIYDATADPLVISPRANETPQAIRTAPDPKAVIRFLLPSPIASLDPLRAKSYNRYIIDLLFDSLFVMDVRANPIPNSPSLVKRWSMGDDNRSAVVELQDGLRWHDGKLFTAADVQFTWDRFHAENVLIREVVAVKKHTVHFGFARSLTKRRAMIHMRFPILPKHVYDRMLVENSHASVDDFLASIDRYPIGNGPFRVKELPGPERLVLERWEEYPGKRPYVAAFDFQVVSAASQRSRMLADGEADAVELSGNEFRWDVNGASFKKHLVKVYGRALTYDYICWNTKGNPFFGDERVRRAMTQALDLDAIRQKLYGGLYKPCIGPYPRGSWMASSKVKLLPYDPAQAANLLDDAGWHVLPDSKGLRSKNGIPLEFVLTIPKLKAPTLEMIGLMIQRQLSQLGVRVKLEIIPWQELLNDRMARRAFQAFIGGVKGNPDPSLDRIRFRSDGAKNYGSYSNQELDGLFDALQTAPNGSEESRLSHEIHELIYQDQPYTFLWQKPTLWAFNKRVRGIELSPISGPVMFHPGPRAWWVPLGTH